MESSSCVILGAARNVAEHLPKTLEKIQDIRKLWMRSAVVFAENDSHDSTRQQLKRFCEDNEHTHILTYEVLVERYKERTERLAFVRNAMMTFIHSHVEYSKYDYILIVDMDGGLNTFKQESLRLCFETTMPEWDALFTNNNGAYYDVWALRSKALGIQFDCWDMYRHMIANVPASPQQIKQLCIWDYQKHIPMEKAPIPVHSAFGGLGLYRLKKTVGCTYNGIATECTCKNMKFATQVPCWNVTCEHVSFHADMIKKHKAKLYIFPKLLIDTQAEHIKH